MLWIDAENDRFFRPDLTHQMHAAFTAAGGRAQLIDAPAFGDDGRRFQLPHRAALGCGGPRCGACRMRKIRRRLRNPCGRR